MQDSLPAGGLRLCRAGVEPAGSLRTVSGLQSPPSISLPPFRGLLDASWAHARRKLFDVAKSGKATPIADEGIAQIQALYRIEKEIRGNTPEVRVAARQERSKPIIDQMKIWLRDQRARVSAKSPIGEALSYIAKHWEGLIVFHEDGRVELDSNSVERTIRPIALNRKNALFAGHDAGAQNWAILASMTETCKLNGVDPHAWLTQTLIAIANGHKQSNISNLMPWSYASDV